MGIQDRELTLMALRDESCLPCRDGGTTLDGQKLVDGQKLAQLTAESPGWEVVDDHHADFRVGWGYVEIEIFSHKANSLTRTDAGLAATFDGIST